MTSCLKQRFSFSRLLALLVVLPFIGTTNGLWAQEAQWIWCPEQQANEVPRGTCHFRKVFALQAPERGEISIAADDQYELFLNGRRIAGGDGHEELDQHDVSRFLQRGRNVVSLRVSNTRGSTAAVAARVLIKERDGDWKSYSTDDSWKSNLSVLPLWHTALYNDNRWSAATALGKLGETPPWDIRETVAADEGDVRTERFKIDSQFSVEELLGDEATGSLISMTFNEFGHILAGRSDGPLLLIYDSDDDARTDQVRVYCDKVKNCQGILALNGEVYVTAEGPDGAALYRLSDQDRDGQLEAVQPLLKFHGVGGEHGAHAVTLGPDGLVYVLVGNHAQPDVEIAESSPYRHTYEGDVVQPRYEDPNGHALGIKAPGGTVLRMNPDGTHVEVVAGGLRNAYDMAFNRQGELFVHDSDSESDVGTTWYRPTRLYHVIPGGEYGWRSGWAQWASYFVDGVPEILATGRGSPTGAAFYNHFAFPTRYHDRLFLADWSEGRILSVELKPDGASFNAESEVFLEGRPMNVTDLEVGPDGALYFVTGGRGTSGGVYRITWNGEVPEAVRTLGDGITAAIRQPQLHSSWTRQRIAGIKKSIASVWDKQVIGVARSKANPWYYRVRAIHLMHLYGPPPTTDLLLQLSEDENELVRAKAVEMMGLHSDEKTESRLVYLLADQNRSVRRAACEALQRMGGTADLNRLEPLLESEDRAESFAARRLLESIPTEQWREKMLSSTNQRMFIQGSLALLTVAPTEENSLAALTRISEFMDGFVSDHDFIDMLRVAQVALHRGQVDSSLVLTLSAKLGEEFPAGDATMNRELIRLLVYLQATEPLDRYMAFLKSEADLVERLHVAMHLSFLKAGWKPGQRLELIQFLQDATNVTGGNSYKLYIENAQRDIAKTMPPEEGRTVLAKGADWPGAALGALYSLPDKLDDATVTELQDLDQAIAKNRGEGARALRVGIVAVLARHGDERAMRYLRSVWEEEPEQRQTVAMGMAQQPDGLNWDYLIRSLSILDGEAARDVMISLLSVDSAPEDPEVFRQVILRGLALGEHGAQDATELLSFWTSERPAGDDATWETALSGWQTWFAERYPDRPKAELPTADTESKWQFDELLEHLTSEAGSKGSPEKGLAVFQKAQCIKCHRFGDTGESLGPDLTSISKRFMKKEVLQSILYPSHVISDQFSAKTLVTTDGRAYTGIVGGGTPGEIVVLQATGEKVALKEDVIDEVVPSRKSAMPDSLLNPLTLEEISDLFAYLGMLPSQSVATRAIGDAPQ